MAASMSGKRHFFDRCIFRYRIVCFYRQFVAAKAEMNLELLGNYYKTVWILCIFSKYSHASIYFRRIESFGQNYPEEFDGSLDCISLAVTCSFNKYGTLLAVGCNDGRIVVWDFLTRGIAKIISAHVHPVCSIGWSRNGHKVCPNKQTKNVPNSSNSFVCFYIFS